MPTEQEIRAKIASVPLWYHRIEVANGIFTPGINDPRHRLARFQFPEDCHGLRVLDLGARDGFFSFELERRGADVMAIDYTPPGQTGFNVARELLDARVKLETANVYDLTPERFGRFDIVLFLDLLYHLRDPMLALDRVWSVAGDKLILETYALDNAVLSNDGTIGALRDVAPALADTGVMQFYPRAILNRDETNWWAPNTVCLRNMLEASSFAVDSIELYGDRAVAHAHVIQDHFAIFHRTIEKSTLPGP